MSETLSPQEIRLLTRIVKPKPEYAVKLGISKEMLDQLSNDGAHADLNLVGYVSLSEASRKHRITKVTLSDWAKRGHLGEVIRTKREVFIFESRLEELVRVFKEKGGPGKRGVTNFVKAHPAPMLANGS